MDGEQRLKRLKRGEDSACLPWSVMVHQLKTSSCPSGALAAMGLGDGTDTKETCKYTDFFLYSFQTTGHQFASPTTFLICISGPALLLTQVDSTVNVAQ